MANVHKCTTLVSANSSNDDGTLSNFIKRKHQKNTKRKRKKEKGREKETRDLEQSPGKQTAQQRQATRRKGNH
jgi:hypothetical protein